MVHKNRIFLTLVLLCTLFMGCKGSATQVNDGKQSKHPQLTDFPYPAVPETLTTVDERAAYVMEHYWDAFDFADTTLVHLPDVTEQGLVNFIDLLPQVDTAYATNGLQNLCGHIFPVPDSRPQACAKVMQDYFLQKMEQYLHDPNSPMRDDALYVRFLSVLTNVLPESDLRRETFTYQLKYLRKNLPGTSAEDFTYIDRKGVRRTLYSTQAEFTLLFFYDPECDNCHAILEGLKEEPLLLNQRVTVLTVYADVETSKWNATDPHLPTLWTDGYSPKGEIVVKQLYQLAAMPTLYLLDSKKRVLLRDPSPEVMLSTLQNLLR